LAPLHGDDLAFLVKVVVRGGERFNDGFQPQPEARAGEILVNPLVCCSLDIVMFSAKV
jgi:hypothetical protein